MADLVTAMSRVFTGGKMTVFQATVDAVGQGVLTIHVNGGSFTDVPYIPGGFAPQTSPNIGDPCYVIGREDWGMLVIGKPAPGPERGSGDPQVIEWEPFTRSRSNNSGGWTAPPLDEVRIQPGDSGGSAAVFFFNVNDVAWPGDPLSTASFYLEVSNVDTYGQALDWAYVEIGLHSTATPGGTYTEMPNLNGSYKVPANAGMSQYIQIPLEWAGRLITGEAKGLYVRTEDFPMTISGPGTLRLTSL